MKWIIKDANSAGHYYGDQDSKQDSESAGNPAGELARALNVSHATARVLYARGIRDAVSARKFLSPSAADLHDPYLLRGMSEAAPSIAVLEPGMYLLMMNIKS